ncbi:hypothetical protein [Neptuniibacter sp. QD48_11]|uniref:hypothetical protein n=1 Tax=unclassified Neptuniibacter TaxID=2630693 RepID=UPI0039F530DC
MKQTTLSADWQSWVEENRARNCDLDEMVEILKQNGFSSETAMSAVYKQQDKANSSPKPLFTGIVFYTSRAMVLISLLFKIENLAKGATSICWV